MFQSSFELTGYITKRLTQEQVSKIRFQSSFELTGYITVFFKFKRGFRISVSKLFRAYRLYNVMML